MGDIAAIAKGRNMAGKSTRATLVTIRIPNGDLERLRHQAAAQDRTLSDMCRVLIKRGLTGLPPLPAAAPTPARTAQEATDRSQLEPCARCGKAYDAHIIETYPPQHADCVGFECEIDHDATGTPCPLRRPAQEVGRWGVWIIGAGAWYRDGAIDWMGDKYDAAQMAYALSLVNNRPGRYEPRPLPPAKEPER